MMCFIAKFNSGPVEGIRSWLGQSITFPTENVSYKKCCNLGQNFLSVFYQKVHLEALWIIFCKILVGTNPICPIMFPSGLDEKFVKTRLILNCRKNMRKIS